MTEKLRVDIAVEADLYILEHRLKKFLREVNLDIPIAILVAKELATNILKYGDKGCIEVGLKNGSLRIFAEDKGKVAVIGNGEKLAGGLGIGLEVVKKSSNDFKIEQKPGGGTKVEVYLNPFGENKKGFVLQVGTASKPHYLEDECGDVCLWKRVGDKYILLVADVLGHGKRAHEVAKVIESYFKDTLEEKIERIYEDLQRYLFSTRGCAAFIARVSENVMEYINVGNIKAWLVDKRFSKRIMGTGGVIGKMHGSPKVFKESSSLLCSTLIVCTDGIKNQFIPTPDMVWLRTLDVRDVALKIVNEYSIKEDDATVLIARGGYSEKY
ncbi:Anti-sigma regulatory factor (Ser/Thr protein kinase) [Caldanaerovirga acetigignens]|uniref:Anti-sigma regulatory factor (Ser/Thr protein kinase) n=1 Tax=Caldanaerovirga acetigignens TaxID=447595 RepID=A0A1M7JVJ9_9FIRM|nr:SpoIIE family protein phosphatase [Caldanaerovirga acetigignens]SHM56955.1 Anti-sigma regulatory factor (Ser/Thr protein kinase) [Caldanaerovirga acetigignens]